MSYSVIDGLVFILSYMSKQFTQIIVRFEIVIQKFNGVASPDSGVSSGSSANVPDVDTLQNVILVAEAVQVEAYRGDVPVRHETHTADEWTGRRTVQSQHFHQLTDELRHSLEVLPSDASRRVQNEHHVGAVCTRCGRTPWGD